INFENIRLMRLLQIASQQDTTINRDERIYFSDERYMKWDDLQSKATAYNRAIENAKKFQNEINNLKFEVYEETYYIRHTDIELLRKFSQALACFILFFIGAPLGALIRKGGLGTSAIVSVLFFVLYWVFDISGSKLARDGAISAAIGAFISSLVLAPIGAFLTWKAVHDAQLFNMDQIKLQWKRFKRKITGFFRPVRIVYMGTPDFAVAPLDQLIKTKHKVVGVVTVPDKPSGRGLKVNESAVKKYAVEHGIPVLQPVKLKDPEFLKALEAWKADMFVVVAFRMLPEVVWQMPKLGTFNLHAALLPQYRGAAPINWAVINGEKRTGVTTFMIDKDIDTGGILLREECIITPEDNAGTVHDKLMEIGKDLVVATVDGLIEGSLEMRVQRSFIQGQEQLKPAPKLTRELCHIKWDDTSKHINNLIRGLSPYPAAFTELVSEQNPNPQVLKIYSAEIVSLKGEPGQILTDGKSYFAIATADGALSLKDVQLAGKKRMDVKSFLAGFRNPEEYKTN
ncbi:MAG: methionyl-tRNA formyltransferase, partial [Bacteroidales bacterium]|nr:methionyl-tRNA formyltransferase [Bacteroidales bacterium]